MQMCFTSLLFRVLGIYNFVLRFFSTIGVFPCNFEEDSNMTPMKPWLFLTKWIIIATIFLGGYLAALWYMLDQSDMGFTWDSFTEYLKNFVSSTITTLDAAGYRKFLPHTFQLQLSTHDFSTSDFSTMNSWTPDSYGVEKFMVEWSGVEKSGVEISRL